MSRVIRYGHGHRQHKMKGISAKDVNTLMNYWDYEEQIGRRQRPQDDFLKSIPPVIPKPIRTEPGNNQDENNGAGNDQPDEINDDNQNGEHDG